MKNLWYAVLTIWLKIRKIWTNKPMRRLNKNLKKKL